MVKEWEYKGVHEEIEETEELKNRSDIFLVREASEGERLVMGQAVYLGIPDLVSPRGAKFKQLSWRKGGLVPRNTITLWYHSAPRHKGSKHGAGFGRKQPLRPFGGRVMPREVKGPRDNLSYARSPLLPFHRKREPPAEIILACKLGWWIVGSRNYDSSLPWKCHYPRK